MIRLDLEGAYMSKNSSSRLRISGQDHSFTTNEGLASIPQDVAEFIGDRPIITGEDAGHMIACWASSSYISSRLTRSNGF